MATETNINPLAMGDPICSTDNIWRGTDEDRCLTDDLNAIEADITALETALNSKASTSHTHTLDNITDTTNYVKMTAAERTKLASIETGASEITVDSALSSTSTNPVQNKVINSALAGKSDTTHNHDSRYYTGEQVDELLSGFAGASHTHTAAEVGAAATSHTHSGYATTSHTHTAESLLAMASVLFGTNSAGGVEYSYGSGSGKNVLTEISNMPQGLHTIYAIAGTTGNPDTTESFRYIIHKTSSTIGWMLAFDAQGSCYTNYQSATNTFKGWKCIYDATPTALWTGGYYMSSSNGTPQTVKPSKKLSECRNGWVLVWSDYDADTSTKNNTDIHHDFVYKRNVAGANWSGQCMLCDIPRYVGSNPQDVDTERRIIKPIYIHDDRIEGSYQNSYDERNDVVLRCVYEF